MPIISAAATACWKSSVIAFRVSGCQVVDSGYELPVSNRADGLNVSVASRPSFVIESCHFEVPLVGGLGSPKR